MLDAGPVDVPYVDQCGNGIVDDGEECDDWNRLNGDGCDWNCRRGDGEPPPPPDPEAIDYLAEGDGPTVIEDVGVPVDAILDLAWTGREFAVALCEDMTPAVHSDDAWQFHFVRFDGYGRRVGPAWRYPASRFASIRLVWTGEGFGLFYNDQGWGIVMLRLDPDGKPYWPPVLAVPDGTARDFDADWTGEAFVVAWTSGAPGAPMSCAPSSGSLMLRVALVDRFGALRDRPAPITVEDEAFGMVNVAAGDLGFAVSFSGRGPSMYLGAYCAPRVVWIDRELDRVVPSGMLSGFGMIRDLGWGGAEFAVAWLPRTDGEWGSLVCSARFGSSGGALLGPPGCVDLIDLEIDGTRGDVRLAARDHGMALLLTHAPSPETPRPVLLLNVDRHGTPVGEPHDVAGSMTVDPASHAIVPSEVGYGVVFGSLGTLALRTFRAAP
ncbi:MAG: hypothetical protein JXB32_04665 [Deltaproteobacteria bacterium]|nr:hypothetical protein [Deltaproteobacteria bacterium]